MAKQTLDMLSRSLAVAMVKRFDDFVARGGGTGDELEERLIELVQVEDFFARGYMTPDARPVALDFIARAHDWLRDRGLKAEYERVQKAAAAAG